MEGPSTFITESQARTDYMEIKIISKKKYPELKSLYKKFKVSNDAEICLAVGGDGTFVRAAREHEGPILPIRSGEEGSVGFYSDLTLKDLSFIEKNLGSGNYNIEHIGNKIEIIYCGKSYYAVNEALLRNSLEEISFKIYGVKDGHRDEIYPYTMSGDGALITGSIGSTAYNKSAGGPIILAPDVMCLTFLNAEGPYRNPIIFGLQMTIEIEVAKYSGMLIYDGIKIAKLNPKDKFQVRLSQKKLKIIRFKERSERLSDKLDRIIKERIV